MDNRPIGIFDSGLGGLTGLIEVRRLLPNENIIYFGDSGRMPYGGRPKDELVRISGQDVELLQALGCKAVLAACGTTSSNALPDLKQRFSLPLIGVIEDAAAETARLASGGRAAILATEASIRTGAYEKALRALAPDLALFPLACPEFAPMVEQGHFLPGDPVAEEAVERALRPLKDFRPDVLLLGCTHYPLLGGILRSIVGDIPLVSCGGEAARGLQRRLESEGLRSEAPEKGTVTYYTSGDPAVFESGAALFLGEKIQAQRKIIG